MIKNYLKICHLLEELGPFQPRLKHIQRIIQNPKFLYDKSYLAEILINTFLSSSYWLDQELFDDSYLYKKEISNLLPMQKVHLEMTNIGATLITKGFPLEYKSENFESKGVNQLASYAKTFSEQCYKRHSFLTKNNIKILTAMPLFRASSR